MKKKVLAAVVCAGLVLSLAGCGSKNPLTSDMLNPQTSKTDGTSNILTANKPGLWAVIPEIPVTDESAFQYRYDSELDGMVITDYLKESPNVRIPDTLAGVPVRLVDLSDCEKEITELVMPDSVIAFFLSGKTEACIQYINLPADSVDYNIWLQNYIQNNTSQQNDDFLTESEFYESFIDEVYYLFGDCENLIGIGVSEKNPRFCSVDGMLCYNYQDRFIILVCPYGKRGSVTIPDNTTEINASAFGEMGNGAYTTTSDGEGEGALKIIYKNKTYNSIYELDNIIKIREDDIVLKAKVVSADANARNLCTEISAWLADNIALGGSLPSKTELGIICVNGTATITNDIAPVPRNNTIKERVEEAFPTATFAANLYLDSSGYRYDGCVFCDGASAVPSNAPGAADFYNGTFHWKSANETGILSTGEIVGTYPKLSHRD